MDGTFVPHGIFQRTTGSSFRRKLLESRAAPFFVATSNQTNCSRGAFHEPRVASRTLGETDRVSVIAKAAASYALIARWTIDNRRTGRP